MKIKHPITYSIALAVIIGGIYFLTNPKISTIDPAAIANYEIPLDSLIFDPRQAGNIRLDKFSTLLKRIDSSIIKKEEDSLLVIGQDPVWTNKRFRRVFYNDRIADNWEKLYSNLPVTVISNGEKSGFKARIVKVGEKEYVHLPYEILFSAITFLGGKNSSLPQSPGSADPNGTNKSEIDRIESEQKGELIQTEGIVWKHVSDLLAKANLSQSSNVTKLCYLWKHAYDNWVYINDPVTTNHEDRWRSASETIETYYFNDNKKYTGDCDDFAILVASFARQIGIESRFVGAYNPDGKGHAYAEFLVPDNDFSEAQRDIKTFFKFQGPVSNVYESEGYWINMDWWSNHIGGEYFRASFKKIYDL